MNLSAQLPENGSSTSSGRYTILWDVRSLRVNNSHNSAAQDNEVVDSEERENNLIIAIQCFFLKQKAAGPLY